MGLLKHNHFRCSTLFEGRLCARVRSFFHSVHDGTDVCSHRECVHRLLSAFHLSLGQVLDVGAIVSHHMSQVQVGSLAY